MLTKDRPFSISRQRMIGTVESAIKTKIGLGVGNKLWNMV